MDLVEGGACALELEGFSYFWDEIRIWLPAVGDAWGAIAADADLVGRAEEAPGWGTGHTAVLQDEIT